MGHATGNENILLYFIFMPNNDVIGHLVWHDFIIEIRESL